MWWLTFLEKWYIWKNRNKNFVSLLRYYVEKDFVVPIVMELWKTNYLYIPFMARTDEEAIELMKNILDGKLRKNSIVKC